MEIREDMRAYIGRSEEVSDRRRNLRRCAELLRTIGERVVEGDITTQAAAELADALLAAATAATEVTATATATAADASTAALEPDETDEPPPIEPEVHPWIGPSNQFAPPMQFHVEGESLVGVVRCSATHGGSQLRVHGGVIAGLFDAIMATRSSLAGGVLTARLTIDFLAPVPLHTELRLEAVVDREEGRKRFASGRLLAGSTLCAKAEALMIVIGPKSGS